MYVSKQNLLSFIQNSELNKNNLDENGLRYIDAEEDLFILVKNEKENAISEEANGVIFEKNTNKIVCTNQNMFKKIENKNISELPSNAMFEYIEDGTVIRLYFNKTWKTATSRCSDAKHSFWGSDVSFDEQFWQIFDKRDLANLDRRNTYMFILKHKLSERVIKLKQNELVFICAISNTNGFENVNYFKTKTYTNFKRPQKIPRNWKMSRYLVTRQSPQEVDWTLSLSGVHMEDQTIFEIFEILVPVNNAENELDFKQLLKEQTAQAVKLAADECVDENIPVYRFNMFNNRLKTLSTLEDYYHPFKRGVLVKIPKENNTYDVYHYDFEQYKKIDELRGNVPTLDERFLELYMKKDFKTIKSLEYYYKKNSTEIKKSLFDLYKTVFDMYVNTHKLHLFKVDETNKFYTTLKQIHALFFTKNKTNINLDEVVEKLTKLSTNENENENENDDDNITKLETIPENKVLEIDPVPTSVKKMIGIKYMDVVNHINGLSYNVVKNLL